MNDAINLGNRIEDFFYEKIDKKKPNRLSNLEYVGVDMIEAGSEFGPGIAYGKLLFISRMIDFSIRPFCRETEDLFSSSWVLFFVEKLKS